MKITINGFEREVTVRAEDNGLWKCTVGKALIYWRIGYTEPYILIKGKNYDVVRQHKSLIIQYLKEYKRLVSKPKATPPVSYVGDPSQYEYEEKQSERDPDYVSGVPKWLTNLKEWKLCSGKKYTYMRRVRLPKEHKDLADKYMSHCCECQFRVDCEQPCTTPEYYKKQEVLAGM